MNAIGVRIASLTSYRLSSFSPAAVKGERFATSRRPPLKFPASGISPPPYSPPNTSGHSGSPALSLGIVADITSEGLLSTPSESTLVM